MKHFFTQLRRLIVGRGFLFTVVLLFALSAFEYFNFNTTAFALQDLIGQAKFAGFSWALILAVAFCGMDLAGIARLFSPAKSDSVEDWYLLGAWFLASTMNAALIWWGVSIALLQKGMDPMLVALLVAVLVWIFRALLIGTCTFGGEQIMKRMAEDLSGPEKHWINRAINMTKVAHGYFPHVFVLGTEQHVVASVLKTWSGKKGDYFRVLTSPGRTLVLRYSRKQGWMLLYEELEDEDFDQRPRSAAPVGRSS